MNVLGHWRHMVHRFRRVTIDRLLDALASGRGTLALGSVFIILAAFNILEIRSGLRSVERAQEVFRGPSVRDAAVAIADINRLGTQVEYALSDGVLSEEEVADILGATDMLFVRTQSLQRWLPEAQPEMHADAAYDSLREIVAFSDSQLSSDPINLKTFGQGLRKRVNTAHSGLSRYLDYLNRGQNDRLGQAVHTLSQITTLHISFLVLILSSGAALAALLRREVLNRRQRIMAEGKVRHLAYHDALTGLPNRARFNLYAETAFPESGARGIGLQQSLACIDLDGFKGINDVYGHQAGDAVLRHVAEALATVSSAFNVFCARLGGDEFAAILPTSDPAHMAAFARSFLQAVDMPVFFDGQQIAARASVGMVSAERVQGLGLVDLNLMIRTADFALYDAKRMIDGPRVRMFDNALTLAFKQRRARLDGLERAIHAGALEVWLQPKVQLSSRQLVGFEALVRWRHEGELIPPSEFISLAEEGNLIVDLDLYMLRASTRCMAEWNRQLGTRLSVSVNLSGKHLQVPRLVEDIRGALEASGLQPELLTLEVTESVKVENWSEVSDTLNRIRALGCPVSLDDFGAGYSSLGYLRRMPADELKLDMSFVEDLQAANEACWIISSVVDIARGLKLHVVAEGIETEEQAAILLDLGCDIGQGYLFGRPLPQDIAVRRWTRDDSRLGPILRLADEVMEGEHTQMAIAG